MADFLKSETLMGAYLMLKFFSSLTTVILIGLMIFIFFLSHETAESSSETSGEIIRLAASIFHPDFDELPENKQAEIIKDLQFIFRKAAHFTLYFLLGLFAFLSVIVYKNLPLAARSAISLGICLLYGISDEIHQLFISGRSGEIRDVCIDFLGSLLSVTILYIIFKTSKMKSVVNNT